MFASLRKFIEIQTRLPKNLNKTAKEYAEQLIKQKRRCNLYNY